MGDLDARNGAENECVEQVISKQWLGEINENDEMLVNFGASYGLVIGSTTTIFP
jgi:hypothetical protein